MPAVLRFDQQSVCASGRFRDYGESDVSRSSGDFPRRSGAVLERPGEYVPGTRDATGARSGSSGSDAGGESGQAHPAYAGLSESDGNVDAACIAAQIIGVGLALPGPGGGRPHLREAACSRGTRSFAEAARPLEPGHSHRQLREGGISGLASRVDCRSSYGDRTPPCSKADDRLAYGPTRASYTRGISAARPVYQAPGENAQGLHFAPGGIGRSAAQAYARRHALDEARGRNVLVAGVAAGIRCQRIVDPRERTRRAVCAGTLLLRASSSAQHAAAELCEPGGEADCARRGHTRGTAED